jgi:hypothetical protein
MGKVGAATDVGLDKDFGRGLRLLGEITARLAWNSARSYWKIGLGLLEKTQGGLLAVLERSRTDLAQSSTASNPHWGKTTGRLAFSIIHLSKVAF